MRLLVVSDQHNSEAGLEWALQLVHDHQPEIIIHLGDVITSRPASFLRESLRKFAATNRPVIVIPGNNDPRDNHRDIIETGSILLHENTFEKSNYRFVGRGASNPTPFKTPFEEEDSFLAATISDLVEPGDIWCFHAPVYGFRDRIDSRTHTGVHSFWDLLNQVRPWVVLSGHIHDDFGMDYYKGTYFINPGALKDLRAVIIDLDKPKLNANFIED